MLCHNKSQVVAHIKVHEKRGSAPPSAMNPHPRIFMASYLCFLLR